MATLFAVSEATQGGFPFPESLTEAYKPRTIGEFVGLQKHKAILSKLAANPPRNGCGLLFHGPSGTGKTSMAFAFARAIDAEIHHLPSQDCKLDSLQNVANTCHRVPYNFQTGKSCKTHAVIIDESDLLSSQAQNFLLSRLDGSAPCPATFWILSSNAADKFEDRLLSRLIQLPKFTGYGTGDDVRDLLTRIWQERAPGVPMPDTSRANTSNVRSVLQWLEVELLSV